MRRAVLSIALLCCAPAFAAENFAGTYTARNPQGNVVTMTLKQRHELMAKVEYPSVDFALLT